MDIKLIEYFNELKEKGLSPEQEEKMLSELYDKGSHDITVKPPGGPGPDPEYGLAASFFKSLYEYNDFVQLSKMQMTKGGGYTTSIRSVDELLERDKQREEDGFPRKIRVGKLIKPGARGKGKVVVVPTTVEEKFMHDNSFKPEEEEEGAGGSGEGEEGEVIGEQPIHAPDSPGEGPGEGEGGQHEIESSAYDLGKILTEQFELPNIKDKGKKRSLTRYTYDMTDRNRGFGQFLDKKATLKKIVETNISLGNLPDINDIDPTGFLISPKDKIYRILSREKDYESQAMVFFVRDYSGSMAGKSTQLVVAQHVLIYAWLLYQYDKHVECRFILHDTEANEVKDFYTYYNSKVAGGTKVASAYKMVNKIVDEENLAKDYNIYVFHGTDGDDWDTAGKETIPELKKILNYVSRMGITIAEHSYGAGRKTEVERYIQGSKLLQEKSDLLRLDVLKSDADEPRLIEGIKKLIGE